MMNHNIIDKFIELHSIRDVDGFVGKMQGWIEKSQLRVKDRDTKQSDYRTFTSRAVSDQQQADLLHNMPIYDYIPLSSEGFGKITYLKEYWKYFWKVDETDKKIVDVVEDAADLGTGILFQGWKIEKRKIEEPYFEDGIIKFKEKEVEQYFGVYSEHIPIENFYCDGTTIENSNEAIWVRYLDKDEWINAHKLNKMYNIPDEIPSMQYYIETYKKLPRINASIGEENLVQELRYYNKSQDKLIILLNGLEVYNSPMPHLHKELPFIAFNNHTYRDRFVQLGNYEMLDEHERYIDAIRSQSVDVTKANIGFNAIPKDSDFNPTMTKIGTFNFIELEEPREIVHIGNNIQPGQLSDLENRAANDVIVLTGVDYRQQLLGPTSETARKTASRNQAQQKRTNKILKKNSFNFYNRFAKLRLADMQFINQIKDVKIPLKGMNQTKDGFRRIQNGYGLFTIPKDGIKGKFDIVLQTESLLGNSTEKEKENYLNFFQVFGNMTDASGKPIVNRNKMVEIAGRKFDINVDELLEKEEFNKDGKTIVEELKAMKKGQAPSLPLGGEQQGVNVIGGGNTVAGVE